MKAREIEVGGVYLAKVSGKLTRVRVDAIHETSDWKGRSTTRYPCTNLITGRCIVVRSCQRFRARVWGSAHPDNAQV